MFNTPHEWSKQGMLHEDITQCKHVIIKDYLEPDESPGEDHKFFQNSAVAGRALRGGFAVLSAGARSGAIETPMPSQSTGGPGSVRPPTARSDWVDSTLSVTVL